MQTMLIGRSKDVKLGQGARCLKCLSASWCCQSVEGLSWGLLQDCKISIFAKVRLQL